MKLLHKYSEASGLSVEIFGNKSIEEWSYMGKLELIDALKYMENKITRRYEYQKLQEKLNDE